MAPRIRVEGSDLGLRVAGPEPRFRIAEPIDETDGGVTIPWRRGDILTNAHSVQDAEQNRVRSR